MYCRLRELGVEKDMAKVLCTVYEKSTYKYTVALAKAAVLKQVMPMELPEHTLTDGYCCEDKLLDNICRC
jgi:hypothetical protein